MVPDLSSARYTSLFSFFFFGAPRPTTDHGHRPPAASYMRYAICAAICGASVRPLGSRVEYEHPIESIDRVTPASHNFFPLCLCRPIIYGYQDAGYGAARGRRKKTQKNPANVRTYFIWTEFCLDARVIIDFLFFLIAFLSSPRRITHKNAIKKIDKGKKM
jgi:hypothetical protein